MVQRLLDFAALRIVAALTPRANRHMCATGSHDEFAVGTAMYRRLGVQMVVCQRPGCCHVAQYAVSAASYRNRRSVD